MCLCDSSLIGKEIRRAGRAGQGSRPHARSREGSKDTFHCPDSPICWQGPTFHTLLLSEAAKSLLVPFSLGPAYIKCYFPETFLDFMVLIYHKLVRMLGKVLAQHRICYYMKPPIFSLFRTILCYTAGLPFIGPGHHTMLCYLTRTLYHSRRLTLSLHLARGQG